MLATYFPQLVRPRIMGTARWVVKPSL